MHQAGGSGVEESLLALLAREAAADMRLAELDQLLGGVRRVAIARAAGDDLRNRIGVAIELPDAGRPRPPVPVRSRRPSRLTPAQVVVAACSNTASRFPLAAVPQRQRRRDSRVARHAVTMNFRRD